MKIKDILEKHFSEVLTEDVGNEIEVMFETLVEAKATEKVEALTEAKNAELEEKCQSDLTEFKEELVEKLNDYVGLTVTDFLIENEGIITENLKAKTADKIMTGVTKLLTECHIDIPESEIDVMKDLTGQISTLKTELNESLNANLESDKQTFEYEKAFKFTELTEALTDSDSEKVMKLIKNDKFQTIEDFGTKVTILAENIGVKSKDILEEDLNSNESDLTGDALEEDQDLEEYEIDKYFPSSLM